jgi:hypothetical protein
MKALLLYPEFPELFWSLKHILRFIAKRATLPALGLFTVAAMLPDKWETRLMYDGQCHGWRGSVVGDDRTTARLRSLVA